MSTLCVNNVTECALSFLKEQAKHINSAIVCSRFNDHIAELLDFQAAIALSAVICGDTLHYDYVCQQANAGCLCVSLDEHVFVILGINNR